MSANPYESPETVGEALERRAGGRWPSLLTVVAGVGIVGVLVALLLLPNVRGVGAREAARRMQCSNNLKWIALALQNYESTYGCLPPAYTVDGAGKPLHSWRTLILPFVEQKALYDRIDLSKAWDDPVNQAAARESPRVYRCPSANFSKNLTGYLAVVALGGCFKPAEPRGMAEITDDKSLTLMVVEVADEHAVHWMSPSDAGEELILKMDEVRRPVHPSGVMGVCVDGRVFFFSRDTPQDVLKALVSVAGKDDEVARGVD
jgi:hypothetical protein